MYGFEQKFMSGAAMNSRRQSLRLSTIGSATACRFEFMKKNIAMFLVVSGLAMGATTVTQAAVTVTAATGGTNVSADRAQNGSAPASRPWATSSFRKARMGISPTPTTGR